MTFVAQPYEQFVDDLLTSLTGGQSREEHRYVGREESYSLAAPDPIPSSIRVFGQYQQAFVTFERGVDYTFVPDDSAIEWREEGRQPDDRSYFYVNYYLQESSPRLTDRNPGAVVTTVGEAFSRQYAVLHKQMELIYRSAYVDFATGTSLDHLAALLGLARKDARFAGGEVLFKRNTPAPADITIPAGTIVSTEQGQNFETVSRRTLRRGQLSIAVAVHAQIEGPPGQVEAGTIRNINRPIFGIEAVVNEEPTFFAQEKESDEAFRQRIKGTLERAGRATVAALKQALVNDVAEVNEGNVQVLENPEAAGVVDVRFGLSAAADADLVQRIEAAIFAARPVGVRVNHNLPSRSLAPSEASAAARQPRSRDEALASLADTRGRAPVPLSPSELTPMPKDLLELGVNVFLYLVDPNMAAAQKAQLADRVRSDVVDYIESLPMGADVVYNKLLARVVHGPEIADADLLVGPRQAQQPAAFYRANLQAAGRKSTVDPADVYVGLMEEAVHVDVVIQLKPTGGQLGQTVSQDLNAALRQVVAEVLANPASCGGDAGQQKCLNRQGVQNAVQRVIDETSAFQMSDESPLTLNAEYEETGRLLNRTEEVVLELHQVARLREFTVNVREVVDE